MGCWIYTGRQGTVAVMTARRRPDPSPADPGSIQADRDSDPDDAGEGRSWRLSGLTGEDLTSQAIWRVLQPVADSRVEHRRAALLTWLGLCGPTPTVAEVQARTGLAGSTMHHWVRVVAAAIRTEMQPLTTMQRQVLSAPIEPGQDRLARERQAALFGLPRPPVITAPWGRRRQALAQLAVRCIAALGPLTLAQLTAGIAESRSRRKKHQADTYDDLQTAFEQDPRLNWDETAGRWCLTGPLDPFSRDAQVVARLRTLGTTFGYQEYRAAMVELGFSKHHEVPFVIHTGKARFALIDQIGPGRVHRHPQRLRIANEATNNSRPSCQSRSRLS